MKTLKMCLLSLFATLVFHSCENAEKPVKVVDSGNMIIRISEIEIDSSYLNEYTAILKEEAAASVKLEPGVVSIYPMLQKDNPTQVRILEIYATKEAYQSHLKTPHFQKYKTTTLKMVKSLRLVDMKALDDTTMALIFSKLKR